MTTVRKIAVSSSVIAVMSAGAFGLAVPALADQPARITCNGNVTCIFDGYNYTAFLGSRSPGQPLSDISPGARNKLSSWINYTTTGSRFYYNTGGGGHCVSMYAQNRATAHAGDGNPDDNQAESYSFTRTC